MYVRFASPIYNPLRSLPKKLPSLMIAAGAGLLIEVSAPRLKGQVSKVTCVFIKLSHAVVMFFFLVLAK